MGRSVNTGRLYVVGLAHKYPPYSYGADDFDELIMRLYPQHAELIGYAKLIPISWTDI
jgi:hypothetical protein